MHLNRFIRVDLRTTDPDAARSFYATAVGLTLDCVSPLPEPARARGAPAHWLGSIAVADLEATSQRLRALGSEPLGPPALKAEDGSEFSVFRDPLGSVVAIRSGPQASTGMAVWHQLHTTDVARAFDVYGELFGWRRGLQMPIAGVTATACLFSWSDTDVAVGAIGDTARLVGVHPHWLYFFPVSDLDAVSVAVRASGGTAMSSFQLPNGDRVAGCEDPQGAAFGILERAR
jgi:predicted enzyme related to lactoylglutathione lyase